MRSSRQTTRIATALSPSSTRSKTTRSLRKFAYTPNGQDGSNDSDDSGFPTHSDSGSDSPYEKQVLGKRKRGKTARPATLASARTAKTTIVRQSPRKAVKEENALEGRKAKRQPAKRVKGEDGTIVTAPPPNWEEVYNVTAEMRKRVLAPVDTMGCESLAEDHRSPRDRRLQTLIALMLSSQTKDTVTAVAMKNLQDNLEGGFCLESLLQVEPERLNELICKVGFHNNKTKFIKSAATILRDQYGGEIPDTIDGLVSLPGVGPKMAYLCMSAAWGRDEGIGVDVHVHRITNLWGWHKTNNPEQTRAELEAWLPKEKWHDINHLLVGFGQTYCPPVGRKCDECGLSARKLCPSAVVGKPSKKKVRTSVQVKAESGEVVKEEDAILEADDAAATIKIKSEDVGEVLMHINGKGVADIEDMGAENVNDVG